MQAFLSRALRFTLSGFFALGLAVAGNFLTDWLKDEQKHGRDITGFGRLLVSFHPVQSWLVVVAVFIALAYLLWPLFAPAPSQDQPQRVRELKGELDASRQRENALEQQCDAAQQQLRAAQRQRDDAQRELDALKRTFQAQVHRLAQVFREIAASASSGSEDGIKRANEQFVKISPLYHAAKNNLRNLLGSDYPLFRDLIQTLPMGADHFARIAHLLDRLASEVPPGALAIPEPRDDVSSAG